MTGRIQALVRTLGGGTDQEELLVMLCQAAETELAGRLRPGLTPEDCESAFVLFQGASRVLTVKAS